MASTLSESQPWGAAYAARRRDLIASATGPGAGLRRALAAATDGWLAEVFAASRPAGGRAALVAVGGYGRGELAPGSDLDLLLLLPGRTTPGEAGRAAEQIWYPVWDSGVRLDHSVRTFEQARTLAGSDLAVLLGLLDARCVAGDSRLVARLRSAVLADWRAAARRRLPALREAWEERGGRAGDLRHDLQPDLKEGRGGLRDLVSLRAVAASWVADRPHRDVDAAVARLADVRDALHLTSGRSGNRLVLQEQDAVADLLDLPDADVLLRTVATSAAAVTHAAEVTWRRALHSSRASRSRYLRGRRPALRLLGPGLAEHEGEAVLTAQADPTTDPLLVLRLAARAARAGLVPSPSSVDRLAADAPPMPSPWPPAARDLLVDLLATGPALVPVWETLDQAGLVERLLPEWGPVRHLPQRNAVHRFSVDRHLVETAVTASALVREVARPDLLLVAALLHDIGKGAPGDHSRVGAPLAAAAATRMGFADPDVRVIETLVLHHLLLPDTATRRDPHDPATARSVASAVGDLAVLELLRALTVADAQAAGPAAWSEWKAGLVDDLVKRSTGQLTGAPPPQPPPITRRQAELVARRALTVLAEPDEAVTWTVTVVAPDRRALFASAAGVLALHRLSVRSAQVRTEDGMAVDVWTVVPERDREPRADALRTDLQRAMAGDLDLGGRLTGRDATRATASPAPVAPPRVIEAHGASDTATVLEVRAHDRPGLLFRLGRALAVMGVDVRSARVATLGAEAVDVFYLQDGGGEPLRTDVAREAVRLLTDAAG